MAVDTSRREILRDHLAVIFQEISTDNGDRNTIRPVIMRLVPVNLIQGYPTLCIGFGPMNLTPINDTRTLFTADTTVIVRGFFEDELTGEDAAAYTRESTGEGLLQDVLRVVIGMSLAHINDASDPYNISLNRDWQVGPIVWYDESHGYFEVTFEVMMRHVGVTFE